jgi:uncharacterized protein
LDDTAWEVLEALEHGGATSNLPREAVAAVLEDIETLLEDGTLSDPDAPDPFPETMGPGVVKAMCLHVAHDCDMRCGYCFAGTGKFGGERSLMPAEVGRAALDLLFSISGEVRHLDVDFFGGEPLLNMEAVQSIVAHGRRLANMTGKILKFTLTTNAMRLDTRVGEFLNENDIAVVLSLDGRPETHDPVRKTASGGPTFSQVAANCAAFVRTRPDGEYYVRGTYTHRNPDFAQDVLFLADMGFSSISFEPVVVSADSVYALDERDLPCVFESYETLVREIRARRERGGGFRFFHFDLDVAHGPCLAKRLSGCGAGREYLAVTPDGILYPCHQFVGREGFVMGDVWSGITQPEVGEAFGDAHIYAKPACATCWARFLCSGGCHASAHQMTGTLVGQYALGCQITKKRLECALALAAS